MGSATVACTDFELCTCVSRVLTIAGIRTRLESQR